MPLIRLQRFLAQAGVASRRGAERLILAGRVTVDGTVVTELGTRVDPSVHEVRLDERRVRLRETPGYLLLHKPKGVLTTLRDPFGRPTIRHLLTEVPTRVFPVGRLDLDSEGLLLLTNDGEISYRLMHPSFKVEKEYSVTVRGRPSQAAIMRLQQGIDIDGRVTLPCRIRLLDSTRRTSVLDVVLSEGRKRQIRNMFAAIGHPVSRLLRVRMGPLKLGNLPPGCHRPLREGEIRSLRMAVGLAADDKKGLARRVAKDLCPGRCGPR